MAASPQLPLPFQHRPAYAAADFLRAPSNEAAWAWLDRTADWPENRLALWGEAGCGKTHLLHIWAANNGAVVLDGATLSGWPTLPAAGGIAIDHASEADEAALLHLLNTAREAGRPVLLAARQPPARWPVALPSLASRLRAVTAVEIGPPEDSLLHALLLRLAADRQLALGTGVAEWLLRRLPRTAAALRDAVARLDQASLAAGGAITRVLAAAALDGMDGFGPER